MGTADDATGGRGPATIAHALAQALGDMQAATAAPAPADRLLYSGTHHETVPRALLFDGRLTPLERNAWQLLRLQVSAEGVAAMRTYEQLRPHLASIPCGTQASHETIARALSVLRLTRWLSLVRRRRDPASGRLLGNVYVLHDAPLTPFEAMHLDAEYLGLVSQALRHASATVKRVSVQVLQEIAEDPLLQERTLPSRLDALMGQLRTLVEAHNASYPQPDSEEGVHESEEGVRESEEGTPSHFSSQPRLLRIPKTVKLPEKMPFFGFRTRTVQYVLYVLKLYIKIQTYVQYRVRAKQRRCSCRPPSWPWTKPSNPPRWWPCSRLNRDCGKRSWTNGSHGAATARCASPPATCSASSNVHFGASSIRRSIPATAMPIPRRRFRPHPRRGQSRSGARPGTPDALARHPAQPMNPTRTTLQAPIITV
ncbi:STY4528 family pathogenicity island replication protein [Achromobacter xylosoxidans]